MTIDKGSFDFRELDEVIHVKPRLGIVAALAVVDEAEFTPLRRVLGVTDGALSIHLRKLEAVGYVSIVKDFVGRKPRTRCRLTPKGRAAFQAYLAQLASLIASAPNAPTQDAARAPVDRQVRERRAIYGPLAAPG